jgi:ATP-dependent RNA helicase DDX20
VPRFEPRAFGPPSCYSTSFDFFQDKLKLDAILSLLSSITFSQCLVFTNFVTKAESFCEKLNQLGWPAIFIASSQDQLTRLNALNR